MVKYSRLGADLQLNKIVFAGSHDAAERNKLKHESMGEAWGLGLTKILQDAKSFVESADGQDEFLILKFDKCSNWPLIAQVCRTVLGNRIFATKGNVNAMKLSDLAGHVICAFMTPGYTTLKLASQRVGITHIKNLYKPPDGYDPDFDGLQYWGAGGTKINNKDFEQKIQENIETQKKLLKDASTGVQAKMKGVFKNIEKRNDVMWDQDHIGGLDTIWTSGFQPYISNALPGNVDEMSFSSGGTLKLFMPNIVMIDFADQKKCDHIHGLNTMAGVKLVEVCRKLDIHGGRNG